MASTTKSRRPRAQPRPQSIGGRLAAARAKLNLTQEAVAKLINVERATISMWENEHDKPGRDRLSQLADVYGTTVDSLLRGDNPILENKTRPLSNGHLNISSGSDVELARIAEPHFREMPQNVPVLGTGEGGNEGDFLLNGEIAEYVRRPAGIANASQVFALWMTGQSMYPRYEEGELIYVHPARRVRIGDDVLIEMRPTVDGTQPALVKRLVKINATEVVVEQFNPPRQITFARDVVLHLFKILTVAELMGI